MKKWTKEEVALLLEYSKQVTPLEQRLGDFPGRTVQSLYHRLRRMNKSKIRVKGRLPFRADDVLKLLEENGPMFAKDITERLGLKLSSVRELLDAMHKEKRIHIKARVLVARTNRAFLWAAGNEADAPQLGKRNKAALPKAMKKTAPVSIVKVEDEMPRQPTQVIVRRDPLVEAFFGRAAA